jgi:hypothetical protein
MPKFKKGSAAAKAYMAKLRAARGKTKVVKTKTKKISGFVKVKAYIKAPLKVREIIDSLDRGDGFVELKEAKILLNKKGYNVEHDEEGNISKFVRIPAKKVGYRADRTTILTRATPLVKKYQEKGYTRPEAIKAANLDVAQKMNSTLFGTKKASSMHKDTKSHNVNIRVVSGITGSEITDKIDRVIKYNQEIERYLAYQIDRVKTDKGEAFINFQKKNVLASIKAYKTLLAENKKYLTALKKLIK